MRDLRNAAGAIVHDWPRLLYLLRLRRGWIRYRNHRETITIDPVSGGARCEWQHTSDLRIARAFSSAARMLMARSLADFRIEFAMTRRAEGEPLLSFVIGHRGVQRLPLLLKTLQSIAAQNIPVECIVVEQSIRPIANDALPGWVRYIHTPTDAETVPYNRSAALNAGARAARTPLLVLHDNDFLIPVRYASEIVTRHQHGFMFMDVKRFMFYLSAADTARVLAADCVAPVPAEVVTQNLLAGGSVGADREAFFEIGGFDERFTGWGGEDNEFWERAVTRSSSAFGTMPLVHLWHAPQPGKISAQASGVPLYIELSNVSPENRIRQLRSLAQIHR